MGELPPRNIKDKKAGLLSISPAERRARQELIVETQQLLAGDAFSVSSFGLFVNRMIKLHGGSKSVFGGKAISSVISLPELDGTVQFKHAKSGGYISDSIVFRLPIGSENRDVLIGVGAHTQPPAQMLLKPPGVMEEGGSSFDNGFIIVGRNKHHPDDPSRGTTFPLNDYKLLCRALFQRLVNPAQAGDFLSTALQPAINAAIEKMIREQRLAERRRAIELDTPAALARGTALKKAYEEALARLNERGAIRESRNRGNILPLEELVPFLDRELRVAQRKIEADFDAATGLADLG